MKYKKVLLPPEPYYSGRVTRYPDRKVAFESGLRWHGSYEISYIKKGKVRLNKFDCEIILNAGDVYVLNSQEVHSYEDIGEDTQAVMLNIIPKALHRMLTIRILCRVSNNPRAKLLSLSEKQWTYSTDMRSTRASLSA